MIFSTCLMIGRLRATFVVLTGLLIVACGSNGGGEMAMPGGSDDVGQPPANGAGTMTDLGEWNTLTAGSLDVRDGNDVLRAYYDSSGGHVMAEAPVQPTGAGTATWTGMWSGRVEVSPDQDAASGLSILGLTPEQLAALGGGARVTAYFDDAGVEAALVYDDIGLDRLGLSRITSGRTAVTDGSFRLDQVFTGQVSAGSIQLTVTGDMTGEGRFGGTNAEGVAGYMGGGISVEYGQQPRDLGTFQSVFYGSRDTN